MEENRTKRGKTKRYSLNYPKIYAAKRKTKSKKERLKIKYFSKKQILDKIRENATLENYKVLSETYKIGKQIWGSRFTIYKLSQDMDMPYTTVYRCLALRKANKSAWKLVKEGKLSVFKLAMICSLKSIHYQDEIVDMVVKDNLSTYQIKSLRINQIEDVNKERHRLAVEKGYARESTAFYNFNNWIHRGQVFLLMEINNLPKDKIPDIKTRLEKLDEKIKIYLGRL